jgi:hypothetical protein
MRVMPLWSGLTHGSRAQHSDCRRPCLVGVGADANRFARRAVARAMRESSWMGSYGPLAGLRPRPTPQHGGSRMSAGRSATERQLEGGVPIFLDQLIRTLLNEQSAKPRNSHRISGPPGGGPAMFEMGTSAAQHGKELLELGLILPRHSRTQPYT